MMRRFAETCEAIAATTSRNEKVRLAAEYLRSLPKEDAAHAAVFLTGRAFPRREETVTAIGARMVWQALAQCSGAAPAAVAAAYRKHGDLGVAAEELLAEGGEGTGLSLREVAEAFRKLAAERGQAGKLAILSRLLEADSPRVAKYLIKILTGDLRIGFKESMVEEAIAAGWAQPAAEVRRANMLSGDIAQTLLRASEATLGSASFRLFQPVDFMLASPAHSTQDLAKAFPEGAYVEDKYDGIRAQVHKQGDRVKLFSRTLDEIVEFGELAPPLAGLPGDWVLDGEIVAWRGDRPLPFTELQQRLGRKEPDLFLPLEIPVRFVAFDLLYRDGELLLDASFQRRRKLLEDLLAKAMPPVVMAPLRRASSEQEFEQEFRAALGRNNEGIMAKHPASPYTVGRRGRHWLKLKQPMATLDVVVTAVEYGHGKRCAVLSDYTFAVRDGQRLVNIGKAYSGLTDAEIRALTEYFLAHVIEDKNSLKIVEPSVVLEVAFNNIQRSRRHESGYALRFPRIVRLRPDKPVRAIDTLERVEQLFRAQSKG
jgi:DNA ligase-1